MASPPSAPRPVVSQDPWRILRWRGRHPAYREELAPGVALTLMRIPAGSFCMGAPEGEEGSRDIERPVRRVGVGEFLMGQTPVTQAQWREVTGWSPREAGEPPAMDLDPDPVAKLRDSRRFLGDQRPVVNVSWFEAREFCRRLKLRTGKRYTLPSEARWEYACRAGTTTPFHFGATLTTELANYRGTATYGEGPEGDDRQRTTEVARFPANAWGLHDMHGNVWEWCADHWHGSYEGAPEDGSPWLTTESDNAKVGKKIYESRLLRGGSWDFHPGDCRSACRVGVRPDGRDLNVGFRVCCLPQD